MKLLVFANDKKVKRLLDRQSQFSRVFLASELLVLYKGSSAKNKKEIIEFINSLTNAEKRELKKRILRSLKSTEKLHLNFIDDFDFDFLLEIQQLISAKKIILKLIKGIDQESFASAEKELEKIAAKESSVKDFLALLPRSNKNKRSFLSFSF